MLGGPSMSDDTAAKKLLTAAAEAQACAAKAKGA
jgi:hypothetical protein